MFTELMDFIVKFKIPRINITAPLALQEWLRNCCPRVKRHKFSSSSKTHEYRQLTVDSWPPFMHLTKERAALDENSMVKSALWCREKKSHIIYVANFS